MAPSRGATTRTSMPNPFLSSASAPPPSAPGSGTLHLCVSPGGAGPALSTLAYTYPLKLVCPAPLHDPPVQTVYLLSYGGGLLPADTLALRLDLGPGARLLLLTQGSTKIFAAPAAADAPGGGRPSASQSVAARLAPGAALCSLPDPVCPFARSRFAQRQTLRVAKGASVCVLDWVCQGRKARGEDWDMQAYRARCDVVEVGALAEVGQGKEGEEERLLLRDSLVLEGKGDYREEMKGLGVYGTLVLHGPLMEGLGRYFHREFEGMPRIGGRRWEEDDDAPVGKGEEKTEEWRRRDSRLEDEGRDGLLWTVSTLRGCTVVKFGARDVEGGKKWLRAMLEADGSVVEHFGERALLCLK